MRSREPLRAYPFEAELLDEAALRGELAAAELVFMRWLDAERGWLLALPARRGG